MTDVIMIITKPGKKVSQYTALLEKQTVPVQRLILVSAPGILTEEDVPGTAAVSVTRITAEFPSEGYLLTMGVKESTADMLLFMNEDVKAVSADLNEKLSASLAGNCALSCARTMPGEKSVRIRDAYQAYFNPEVSEERTECTLFRKGPLQFMTGGSAVMIRKEDLALAGGFEAEALVDPFSIIAAELFYMNKTIHYEAEAVCARTPESASPAAVFRRAFDLSAGMRAHMQIFGLFRRYDYKDKKLHKHPVILMTRPGIYTGKFGFSVRMLSKQGRIYTVPALFFLMLTELLGNAAGSGFKLWPTGLSRFFSGHRSWFTD